jgi:hypothetical protein
MFNRTRRTSARLDQLRSDVVGTTVGGWVALINRLAFDTIRRRTGFEQAPIVSMSAAEQAIRRDAGTMVTAPERLASYYEQVCAFSEAQLANDSISEFLAELSVDPLEAQIEYSEVDEGVLDMAIHRRSFVWGVESAMTNLGMETGPELRGELELQWLDEAASLTVAMYEEGRLWAPISAFTDSAVLAVHRRLAEFCWQGGGEEVRMAWPLPTEAETAGFPADDRTMEVAVLETKECPDCAETIKAAANVCRYCGYRFDVHR